MIQNLDLYPVFMQTAKSRSISRAAKEMHISQPAVSLAIGKLEDALGVKLFFRSNRGISLTNEGSILLEHLSSAFSLIEAGEEKLRDIAGLRSGTLRIGASDMTLRFFLLDYLERFRDLYPGVRLTVRRRRRLKRCAAGSSTSVSSASLSTRATKRSSSSP